MATSVNNELLNAPLPQMIERLGVAIAEAQFAMDNAAVKIATLLGDVEDHGVDIAGRKRSLLELGFQPTFYQFTEATIDAKVAFSSVQSREATIGGSVTAFVYLAVANVNASYTSKWSFDASGSSAINARLVAVPPPTLFADALRELMQPAESE